MRVAALLVLVALGSACKQAAPVEVPCAVDPAALEPRETWTQGSLRFTVEGAERRDAIHRSHMFTDRVDELLAGRGHTFVVVTVRVENPAGGSNGITVDEYFALSDGAGGTYESDFDAAYALEADGKHSSSLKVGPRETGTATFVGKVPLDRARCLQLVVAAEQRVDLASLLVASRG